MPRPHPPSNLHSLSHTISDCGNERHQVSSIWIDNMRSEISAFTEREGISEYGRAEWINNDKNKWNAWLPVNVPQVKREKRRGTSTCLLNLYTCN